MNENAPLFEIGENCVVCGEVLTPPGSPRAIVKVSRDGAYLTVVHQDCAHYIRTALKDVRLAGNALTWAQWAIPQVDAALPRIAAERQARKAAERDARRAAKPLTAAAMKKRAKRLAKLPGVIEAERAVEQRLLAEAHEARARWEQASAEGLLPAAEDVTAAAGAWKAQAERLQSLEAELAELTRAGAASGA